MKFWMSCAFLTNLDLWKHAYISEWENSACKGVKKDYYLVSFLRMVKQEVDEWYCWSILIHPKIHALHFPAKVYANWYLTIYRAHFLKGLQRKNLLKLLNNSNSIFIPKFSGSETAMHWGNGQAFVAKPWDVRCSTTNTSLVTSLVDRQGVSLSEIHILLLFITTSSWYVTLASEWGWAKNVILWWLGNTRWSWNSGKQNKLFDNEPSRLVEWL